MDLELSTNGLDVSGFVATTTKQTNSVHNLDDYKKDVDLQRLTAALAKIEPHDFHTWNKIGLALKNESEDLFVIWKYWSKRSHKSKGCDLRAEWDKLNPSGAITIGSIFHWGKEEKTEKYQTFNLDTLMSEDFKVDYLIPGMLVEGQPCLCFGPSKCLKTSVSMNMALCLATGSEFLGSECKLSKVLFMSGESGMATLQDLVNRILDTFEVKPEADYFHLSPNLPRFDQPLDELESLLIELKTEVLFIDPAYLCMDGTEAGNMFKMGQQLKNMADLCTRLKITLVLAHHSTKSAGKECKPLELSDMAWSGFGEFARQWLMLSRRKKYIDGTGEHKLYLRTGGSAGHSQLLNIDINEGVYPKRYWEIVSKSDTETIKEIENVKYQSDVVKVQIALANGPMSKTNLRNASKFRPTKEWPDFFGKMLSEGLVEPSGRKFKLPE